MWLLNRGNRKGLLPEGVHQITADIHDEEDTAKKLEGLMGAPEHLESMAKQAPLGMEEFQLPHIIGQWKKLIRQLLE